MRLIDADEFKAVNGMKDDCADCDKELRGKSKACEFDRVYTKMDFCGWLDDAPTVDAVSVVRCGECNFWDKDHISCEGLAKCLTGEGGIRYRNRSDFCSKGRKREGDHHDNN